MKHFVKMNKELSELEILFQKFYYQYAKRHLDKPHAIEKVWDILNSIPANILPPKLMKYLLSEDLFFSSELDIAIYQHIRYLPVYWHSHNFLEIIYVMEGNCTHYIAQQELPLQKGDICIIAPNTKHGLSAFSEESIIFNILIRTSTFEQAFFGTLSGDDVLAEFFTRILYHTNPHPYLFFRTDEDSDILHIIRQAYQEFHHNNQYKKQMLNNIITTLFILLLRNHGNQVIFPKSTPLGQNENLILILKYMQANYRTITLKELSAIFNYSERQLQRIIQTSTGMSFHDNIQKLKMKQAARLLENSNLSVAEIATELGYADPSSLRNSFKKYYEMPPAKYRLLYKKE